MVTMVMSKFCTFSSEGDFLHYAVDAVAWRRNPVAGMEQWVDAERTPATRPKNRVLENQHQHGWPTPPVREYLSQGFCRQGCDNYDERHVIMAMEL